MHTSLKKFSEAPATSKAQPGFSSKSSTNQSMSPSFPNLLLFLLLLSSSIPSSLSSHPHIIKIPSSIPNPTSLSYDPSSQHFIIASSSTPTISSISDAGVAETIISDSLLLSISSISLDNRRRRLLVSTITPPTLIAYDLLSLRPHRRIFSSPLPSSPSAIAVDPHTGFAFVASHAGAVCRVGLDGAVSELSKLEIYGGGVVHVRKGLLLVVKGKIFKVDEEDGGAKEVVGRNWNVVPETQGVELMKDGGAVVVAWRKGVRMVKGLDGWTEAVVTGEVRFEGGRRVRGVTTREGKKVYVLVEKEEKEGDELGCGIEEVEWEEEEDLLWLMVFVGFGLAYFLYWRFQMRQLVSNMNKKRA